MRDIKGRFQKGENHPLYGKNLSEEYKKKVSEGVEGEDEEGEKEG